MSERVLCPLCGREVALTKRGKLVRHGPSELDSAGLYIRYCCNGSWHTLEDVKKMKETNG